MATKGTPNHPSPGYSPRQPAADEPRRRDPDQPIGDGHVSEERPSTPQLAFRAPRTVPTYLEHGTKVSFRFTCDRCGEDEELPFTPKTSGDKLCRDCALEVFGPNWARGRQIPPRPTDIELYSCATCSYEEERNTNRPAPEDWRCSVCRSGLEPSNPKRLRGGVVVDETTGVRRLSRKR